MFFTQVIHAHWVYEHVIRLETTDKHPCSDEKLDIWIIILCVEAPVLDEK